ncbi:MAG: hypothetical protein GWP19_02950 [Planctomycetia bacterium]|nr:hypothetical protein [Planctomycetia bacterium]
MCSYYELSIYNILNGLNSETPVPINNIYKFIKARHAQNFVTGLSILKVIQSLDKYGIVEQKEKGYLISQSGIEWRKELSEIVPVS